MIIFSTHMYRNNIESNNLIILHFFYREIIWTRIIDYVRKVFEHCRCVYQKLFYFTSQLWRPILNKKHISSLICRFNNSRNTKVIFMKQISHFDTNTSYYKITCIYFKVKTFFKFDKFNEDILLIVLFSYVKNFCSFNSFALTYSVQVYGVIF